MWRLGGWRERKALGYTVRAQREGDDEDSTCSSLSPGHWECFKPPRLTTSWIDRNDGITRQTSGDTMGTAMSLGEEGLVRQQAPPALRRHRHTVQRLAKRDAPAFQTRGLFNVRKRHESRLPLLHDFYHVILHLHLTYLVLLFWALYLLSFLGFAALWLLISDNCNVQLHTFWEAFCFSIETQMNVGYGANDSFFDGCIEAVWVMPVQSLLGVILDCCLIGMVFQVASRGTNRALTIVFSDTAVLQVTGDCTHLVFRVAEMSARPLLQARMQVYCVQHHEDASSPGGIRIEVAALALEDLSVDARTGVLFFGLPAQVMHNIDSSSPLAPPGKSHPREGGGPGSFHLPEQEHRRRDPRPEEVRRHLGRKPYLEVVVLVSGTEDSSASSVEARHSYTLDDIFWDRMFVPCVSVDRNGSHSVDLEVLHETVPSSWSQVAQVDRRVQWGGGRSGSAASLVGSPSFH